MSLEHRLRKIERELTAQSTSGMDIVVVEDCQDDPDMCVYNGEVMPWTKFNRDVARGRIVIRIERSDEDHRRPRHVNEGDSGNDADA